MEAPPKRVLTPAEPKKILSSEGGSYYAWASSDLCMLAEAKVGAAKLLLNHRGLALPKYSDSSKVGYVLQGSGVAGILIPEAESERVVKIRKGDAIAVPMGVISWWFNNNPSEVLEILFLGDTSKAHRSGEFTDFYIMNGGTAHRFPDFVDPRRVSADVTHAQHSEGEGFHEPGWESRTQEERSRRRMRVNRGSWIDEEMDKHNID